jgi:GTP-binding protein
MRASGSDAKAVLKPALKFSMEMALEYIEDDELVEITPAAVRMRKIFLKEGDRKRQSRHQS